MGLQQDIDRVVSYCTGYLESARTTTAQYPSVNDAIPAFLKGRRRVEIHAARDGAVVVMFDDDEDSFETLIHDESTAQVVQRVSGESGGAVTGESSGVMRSTERSRWRSVSEHAAPKRANTRT